MTIKGRQSTLEPPWWPIGMASAIRAWNTRIEPRFPWLSLSSDLKIGTLAVTLPGACCNIVSRRNGWFGVSILWLGEIANLIFNFSLGVGKFTIVWTDPLLRYTIHVAGMLNNQEKNNFAVGVFVKLLRERKVSRICLIKTMLSRKPQTCMAFKKNFFFIIPDSPKTFLCSWEWRGSLEAWFSGTVKSLGSLANCRREDRSYTSSPASSPLFLICDCLKRSFVSSPARSVSEMTLIYPDEFSSNQFRLIYPGIFKSIWDKLPKNESVKNTL